MRTAAAIAVTLGLTSHALAQSVAAQAVSLFKEVCADPATPEALIAAGERVAKEGNWQLEKSGPMPLPFMHNERGEHIAYGSLWRLTLPPLAGATLSASIIRPEIANTRPELLGVRFSTCLLSLSVNDFMTEALTTEVDKQFGPDATRHHVYRNAHWYFSSEKANGRCSREISVGQSDYANDGKKNYITLMDVNLPNDRWPTDRCPMSPNQ
jgi:hypothetical protein